MEKLYWTTQKRKINDLVPYEHNPRLMSDKQVEDLKKSIEKFDLVEIPAVNTDNTLIAGHQRLRIMQLIGRGEEEIDVRIPNRQLTQEEFDEYLIRSNKNVGDWDWDLLSNFEKDFLEETGFTSHELDLAFGLNELMDIDKLKEELKEEIENAEETIVYKFTVPAERKNQIDKLLRELDKDQSIAFLMLIDKQ
jgi:ParB-like chromosome segregation protein Spo0J